MATYPYAHHSETEWKFLYFLLWCLFCQKEFSSSSPTLPSLGRPMAKNQGDVFLAPVEREGLQGQTF